MEVNRDASLADARSDGVEHSELGSRLRAERVRQKIGVRELAREVGVSASMISQIELGRAQPSVSTLYAIVQHLGLSMDQLFQPDNGHPPHAPAAEPQGGRRAGAHDPRSPVVHPSERPEIHLGSGVTWANLAPESWEDPSFLYATYDVGSESTPADALIRHGGREYGYVLEGRLGVTLGFRTYVLDPGDSIAFDSTTPHRLFNLDDRPTRALWCVIGREDHRAGEPGPHDHR